MDEVFPMSVCPCDCEREAILIDKEGYETYAQYYQEYELWEGENGEIWNPKYFKGWKFKETNHE